MIADTVDWTEQPNGGKLATNRFQRDENIWRRNEIYSFQYFITQIWKALLFNLILSHFALKLQPETLTPFIYHESNMRIHLNKIRWICRKPGIVADNTKLLIYIHALHTPFLSLHWTLMLPYNIWLHRFACSTRQTTLWQRCVATQPHEIETQTSIFHHHPASSFGCLFPCVRWLLIWFVYCCCCWQEKIHLIHIFYALIYFHTHWEIGTRFIYRHDSSLVVYLDFSASIYNASGCFDRQQC